MFIVLFDGDCNLCNSTVQFIINKDRNNKFKFSSLQSEFGEKFLMNNKLNSEYFSTIILIDENNFYTKSTAVLTIAKNLNGYKWMKIFLIIPKFIRDSVYMIISRNRSRFFNTTTKSCLISTKEIKEKFIL